MGITYTGEEPVETLFSGARIYSPDPATGEALIELPLTEYCKQDPEDYWKLAAVALIEARRLGYTSSEMGHPSTLIGEARRWVRDNQDLSDTIKKGDARVWLVIRPGTERLLYAKQNDVGDSAYRLAVAGGYPGTLVQWLTALDAVSAIHSVNMAHGDQFIPISRWSIKVTPK